MLEHLALIFWRTHPLPDPPSRGQVARGQAPRAGQGEARPLLGGASIRRGIEPHLINFGPFHPSSRIMFRKCRYLIPTKPCCPSDPRLLGLTMRLAARTAHVGSDPLHYSTRRRIARSACRSKSACLFRV